MPNVIQTKSILAKLLATEDISIEHRADYPTAAFDVKNRKLFLPVWKEMSTNLYDLFIGHEVGHAFETPEEGWHDYVIDDVAKKGFLNVVEDVRIEKKVKERYPGLVKSFYKGYQELVDKDFFGIKDLDINELPLVDRVNLHYKVGHLLGVKFSAEEKDLVERIGKVETWDDVIRLADELYAANKAGQEAKGDDMEQLIKELMPERFKNDDGDIQWSDPEPTQDSEQEESEQEMDSYGSPIDNEIEDDYDDEDGWGDEGTEEEEEEKSIDEQIAEAEAKEEEARKQQQEAEAKQKDEEMRDKLKELKDALDENKSFTDEQFREKEKDLVEHNPTEPIYASPTDKDNGLDYIIPMEKLYNWNLSAKCFKYVRVEDEDGYKNWDHHEISEHKNEELATEIYNAWLRKQTPIINQMAQQFEIKKQATAFKKAKISKTGDLNKDKLWAYKLTEDLFKQSQIIPNGKNHGLLMFVDMSGSMHRNMAGTLEQMQTMALFCRKVNIPFDAYGFTDNAHEYFKDQIDPENKDKNPKGLVDGDIAIQMRNNYKGFGLAHMLSSKCSKPAFINSMKYVSLMSKCYDYRRYYNDYGSNEPVHGGYIKNPVFNLGGTPLNSSIIAGVDVAKDFQKRYHVERLTTIFLTDGDATDRVNVVKEMTDTVYGEEKTYHKLEQSYGKHLMIRDKGAIITLPEKDQYSYGRDEETSTLLEWYKQVTGSKMINFHIIDGKKAKFHEHTQKNLWMEGKEQEYWASSEWTSNVWKGVLTNKFTIVEDKFGYDARFLLKGRDDLKIQDQELEVKSNKKGDLMRGFRNFQKGKSKERLFLTQVIDLVA